VFKSCGEEAGVVVNGVGFSPGVGVLISCGQEPGVVVDGVG